MRTNAFAVTAFEARKLLGQRRTWVTLLAAIVVPVVVAFVLNGQPRPPKDTLFGRYIYDTGWAIPLLLLGFAGQWLVPLLTSVVAGDVFASEDQHGTWKTILTRSASRGQLFVGKVVVALAFALIAFALLAASTIASGVLVAGNHPLVGLSGQVIPVHQAARLVVEAWATAIAPLVSFTCLALMLSVVTRNVAIGIAAPVGIGFVLQLLGAVGGLEAIRPLLITTPLEAWHGLFTQPAFHGPLIVGMTTSAAWSVVSLVIAYIVFRRRDYQG